MRTPRTPALIAPVAPVVRSRARRMRASSLVSLLPAAAVVVGAVGAGCDSSATGVTSTSGVTAPSRSSGGSLGGPDEAYPGASGLLQGASSGPATATWDGSAPKGSVPLTGGTLLVTKDGLTAVAADPDRDTVSLVDLGSQKVLATITLPKGAEPGRVVEDGSGQVHVVLRRGGGIADIDLFGHKLLGLRQVCALPRGIAYRATDSTLLVSCLTGALVTMDTNAAAKAPLATVNVHMAGSLVGDLRDVLVVGSSTYVTTFRLATVLKVDENGLVIGQPVALNTRVDPSAAALAANGLPGGTPQNYVPAVAWRSVVGPNGDIVVVHQGGTDRVINVSTQDNGGTQTPVSTSCSSSEYGGETCSTVDGTPICTPPIIIGATSSVSTSGVVSDGPTLSNGALPVDIAISSEGKTYVVALGGNTGGAVGSDGHALQNVVKVPAADTTAGAAANAATFDSDLCGLAFSGNGYSLPGQVTSVALDPSGQVVAQTREPATLQYVTASGTITIPLSATTVADEGYALFHTNTGRGMTCAGCHAEGQDDARTWTFTDGFDAAGHPVAVLPRRTQTFRAGFLATAPFHWDGEFPAMSNLISDVFVHRMAASSVPSIPQQAALEAWMNGIPPKMHDAPSPTLAASIAAGKALFEDATVGCTSCHSGANFTNNLSADIGFGKALQTPTLIDVAFRAPYLHDGSVASLRERFTDPTAMSGKHGTTSQLSAAQIDELVAYMESL